VTVCGPATLIPKEIERLGVEVSYNMREALYGAEVVNILRLQLERQKEHLFPSLEEYTEFYGLDAEKLSWASGIAWFCIPDR